MMKLTRYILVFMLSMFCVSNVYAGTGTNDGTNFPTSGVWPGVIRTNGPSTQSE